MNFSSPYIIKVRSVIHVEIPEMFRIQLVLERDLQGDFEAWEWKILSGRGISFVS